MAEPFTIDYRGYAITFSENREVWWCQALDLDAEKLSTVKAKIDRIVAASRKISNVPAIYKDYHDHLKDVTLVAIAQPRKERSGVEAEPSQAWCMVPGRERYFDHNTGKYEYRDVLAREKLSLSQLFKDTPENRSIMAEAERLQAEIHQLGERKKATLARAEPLLLTSIPVGDPANELTQA